MKMFVVLSLLLVSVYGMPPELEALFKTELKRLGDQCKGEVIVGEDDLAPLLQHALPTTHAAKCFLACLHKKTGLQDASGQVKSADQFLDKIKSMDEEYYAVAKEISDICVVESHNSDDECETAYTMYSCVLDEKKKRGMTMINLGFD